MMRRQKRLPASTPLFELRGLPSFDEFSADSKQPSQKLVNLGGKLISRVTSRMSRMMPIPQMLALVCGAECTRGSHV